MRAYGAMVMRRCRRLLRGEEDARDACQDVFVRLISNRHRLDNRHGSSLLYRIATNVSLNRIRDRRSEPAAVDEDRLRHRERRRSARGQPCAAAARVIAQSHVGYCCGTRSSKPAMLGSILGIWRAPVLHCHSRRREVGCLKLWHS